MTAIRSGEPARPWRRIVAGIAIGVAVVSGLALILVATTLGRCDAFGGRCPGVRPSLFDDDVFGMGALGAALVVAVPMFLSRPSKRRLLAAVGVGLVAALIVGLLARSSAYG
jgi:hypothetical protein